MSECVVVAGANSGVILRSEDPRIRIENLRVSDRTVTLEIFSRYEVSEFGFPVPRELVAEVRGDAESLDEARVKFNDIANSIFGLLALAANTWIEEASLWLAFESDPALTRRAFVQSINPRQSGLPRASKFLRVPATLDLFRAVASSPHHDRLRRAIEQYRLALRYWTPGFETLAVAHLFMAAEALKVASLRRALKAETEAQLAARWDVPYRGQRGTMRRGDLEAAARKELVFHGDSATHDAAQQASDGLEHGYADFRLIALNSQLAKEATASHIRRTIIELSDVAPEHAETLLGAPLANPTVDLDLQHLIVATLVGDGPVAPEDNDWPYPGFSGEPSLRLEHTANGRYRATFEGTATARLPQGITAEDVAISVVGPPDPTGRISWQPMPEDGSKAGTMTS